MKWFTQTVSKVYSLLKLCYFSKIKSVSENRIAQNPNLLIYKKDSIKASCQVSVLESSKKFFFILEYAFHMFEFAVYRLDDEMTHPWDNSVP